MQQEFYIGQKVKTSQVGIEKGCSEMQGEIFGWNDLFQGWWVAYDTGSGIFLEEEIELIGDSSVSEIVFDNIVKSL